MINKKRIVGAILAGVLTVAGATSAFAADSASIQPAVGQRQLIRIDKTEMSSKIKSAIDGLVSAGTITQVQADAVTNAYTTVEGRKMPKVLFKDPNKNIVERPMIDRKIPSLDSLVTSGTITQAQADAFITAIKSARETNKSAADVLKELVAAGTITQAQVDAFSTAIKSAREANKSAADVLKDLVAAGTITQAQADAIQKICTPFPGKGIAHGILKGPGMKLKINPLDELVKAGTITQAQEDAINTAIKSALGSLNKQ